MEQPTKAYRDLFTLMREEPAAKTYFEELPAEVKEEMSTHAFRVNSLQDMRTCADSFTRQIT